MRNKYSKYKSSGVDWIGDIPNHWNQIRLSYLFDIKKGKIPTNIVTESNLDTLPYLSMEVIRGNEPKEFSIDKKVVIVKPGDIGILWDGSNSGEVVKINQHGILSSTVSQFSVKNTIILNDFGYYILKFFEFDFKINTIGMGIPHVNGNHLRESKLLIPPTSEQKQIVKYLDKKTSQIDNLIYITQKKIVLLKQKRTTLIKEVTTKGLNKNVKLKNSGVEWIGMIPEHWEVKKMKYFVKICNGSDYKDFIVEDGGYPVYGTGGVFSRSSKYIYDKVSVLLGRKGTVNKPQIVTEPFWTSDTIYYTEIKENVQPFYFFYLVNQINFDLYVYGSAIPSMTKSDYDNMLFPYPPITEQQQIVNHIDSHTSEIDELVSIEQRRIDTLKEYRQSLICNVVTGKLRVCEEARTHQSMNQ